MVQERRPRQPDETRLGYLLAHPPCRVCVTGRGTLVQPHAWRHADHFFLPSRGRPAGRESAGAVRKAGPRASQLRVVPCLQGKAQAEGKIMRVFVTGATGAPGRHLVPRLVAAGHEVTATTRAPGKVAQVRAAGAEPVILDGLDREAVIAAVRAAAPEVIVHQMTALAGMRSLRRLDRVFAATNELRTRGTDNLLAAAARAGTRRVIAQGYAGPGPDKRSGGRLKTEEDPP